MSDHAQKFGILMKIGVRNLCPRARTLFLMLILYQVTKPSLNKVNNLNLKVLEISDQFFTQIRFSTCPLTSFFWLLSHVIYLKLTKVLYECLFFPKLFLYEKIYSYTKKNYFALGNLAKLMFWSILSFKNLQDWKVNIFLSFSGES